MKKTNQIIIAEALGFRPLPVEPSKGAFIIEPKHLRRWKKGRTIYYVDNLPEFTTDYMALRSAIVALVPLGLQKRYRQNLARVTTGINPNELRRYSSEHREACYWAFCNATIEQRAVALIQTLDLTPAP